jgi:hypothetical protein
MVWIVAGGSVRMRGTEGTLAHWCVCWHLRNRAVENAVVLDEAAGGTLAGGKPIAKGGVKRVALRGNVHKLRRIARYREMRPVLLVAK